MLRVPPARTSPVARVLLAVIDEHDADWFPRDRDELIPDCPW
ncbi:MAG: hypothetical protein ACYCVL_07160 [Gemmatimonadaceae bacterium]